MSETKQRMDRLAALRVRLDPPPACPIAPERANAGEPLEEKVQRATWHHVLLDSALRAHQPPLDASETAVPTRLTARGNRVLKKGRELLQALRSLSEKPLVLSDGALAMLHQEATALLDTVLRSVQAFPPTPSVQLRLCEGLEAILTTVEERLLLVSAGASQRGREEGQIDALTDLLSRLAVDEPIGLGVLQEQANRIIADAATGQALRFQSADPSDPARFTAAHGINVAQVVCRLVRGDAEREPQLQTAVMAALVHDVGQLRVSAEVLAKPGPLSDDERRLIEQHTTLGGPMVAQLWPGGGWPVEAVTDHHERLDGTGYPLGRKEIQLASFVKLLAVCDVYAALCAPRPHRAALEPRTALTDTLLMADHGLLDKNEAERLLVLSFYPPGTAVLLDDGAVAIVVATHVGMAGLANPARPLVQVLTDAQGLPPALPTVVDLAAQSERRIVRGLTPAERRQSLGRKYPALS